MNALNAPTILAVIAAAAGLVLAGPAGGAGAASGAAATVSPSTNLADGQMVALHAGGLPAERTIQVEECAGTAQRPPPDNTSCDGLTLDTQAMTDREGNYDNAPGDARGNTGFRVYTRPSPLLKAPTTIACDAGHPCVLYIGVDQNDFSQPHVFADIQFSMTVKVTTPPAAPPKAAPAANPAPVATPVVAAAVDAQAAGGGAAPVSPAPVRTSRGTGALPFTGSPQPVVGAGGLLALVVGSTVRRRAHRPTRGSRG